MQNNGLGPEALDPRQDQPVQHRAHLGIVEAARHRQVEAVATAFIGQMAGEGPAPFFVDRDQQCFRILGKGGFHPVTMMRVDIDIGDAPYPGPPQHQHRQHGVVGIAEPVRAAGQAMMRAPGGHIDDPGVAQQLCRQHRAPRRGRRAAEHLGEDRV